MKYGYLAALSAGLALSAAGAGAAELLFTFNDGTGDIVTWEQPSNPVPLGSVAGQTTVIAISDYTVVSGTAPPETFVDFFSYPLDNGGFETGSGRFNYLGAQVYTGPEDAPQFTTGTFDMAFGGVMTVANAPEPAAWALMLTGLAGLGATLRRRRQVAAAA